MTNKAFFMRRLNDHIQYLKQIEAAIKNHTDFKSTHHKHCQLGQWLYNEGPAIIAAMKDSKAKEVYDSLLEPHEQFHILCEEALNKAQMGDEAGAKVALTKLHLLSTVLTKKLLELDNMS